MHSLPLLWEVRVSEKPYHVWQERAPQGPLFVHTPHDGDIFFGRDEASAEQCLAAFDRLSNEIERLRNALAEIAPLLMDTMSSELRWCGYCESWHSKPCGEGCHWSPTDPTQDQLAKGEGRFSRDPFTHACNTIEDMKELAAAVLSTHPPMRQEGQR